MRILASGCLMGIPCGVDGTSYGAPYSHLGPIFDAPNVEVMTFCPEDFAFGTPRETPDIDGGNGFDVLDGRARVFSKSGRDWTEAMVQAAEAMVEVAQRHSVHLAVLTDISAACGSQVIYLGARANRVYQAGQGVCAALLIRRGFQVVSHRDYRTIGRILRHLDRSYVPDPAARDHHESAWYVEHFAG